MASAAFNGAGAGSNGGGSHGSPLLPQSPLLAPASAVPSPQQRLAELESTTVHGAAGAAAAAARAPNTEVYGFVMYLASFITFALYLFWAYVPDEVLHSLGFEYYPSKWWAIALPMYSLVLVAYIFCVFVALSIVQTAPFDSPHAITDEHANVVENLGSQTFKNEDRVPDLMDVPISVVNQCLFHTAAPDDGSTRLSRLKRPWPSQPNLPAMALRATPRLPTHGTPAGGAP